MKTAISIPDKLFKHAEETARKLGISRSRLFSIAIKEFLRFHYEVDITSSLDEIYEHESSAVDEQVQQMQVHSIAKEEW
jgi:metal-responsive CopG/Arc/MetJ family transcriptional regulator